MVVLIMVGEGGFGDGESGDCKVLLEVGEEGLEEAEVMLVEMVG
nr:hypothetical protein [Staphylococcus capitis]